MAEGFPEPLRGRSPECGSENVKKIVYGYPLGLEFWPKHLVPGGCCVSGNHPTRHCGECGNERGWPYPWPEGDGSS